MNNNSEYGKFLPLGTVVLLKGGKKRLMITGFCMVSKESDEPVVYDYCGCPFPEGQIKTDKLGLFNHEQIDKVFYLGLRDQEETEFKANLDKIIKLQIALADRNLGNSNESSGNVNSSNLNN